MVDLRQEAGLAGQAILRMELRDHGWPLVGLTAVFQTLNHLYLRLRLLTMIGQLPHPMVQAWARKEEDAESMIGIILGAHVPIHSTPLVVQGIELHSPGWLELVGAWHPLKILADGIQTWRSENTKRMEIQRDEQLRKLEIRADLAKAILEKGVSGGPLFTDTNRDAGQRLLLGLTESITRDVEILADDPRILTVEVRPLPPDAQPPRLEE